MQITLIPIRRDTRLALERHGDRLHVNGTEYDFSALPEGALLPRAAVAGDWLAGDVERRDGRLHLALFLPHGETAPPEARFPAPLILTADGPVALPPCDMAGETEEME